MHRGAGEQQSGPVGVSADAGARRRLPPDEAHGAQGLQPVQQRHYQAAAQVRRQVLAHHRSKLGKESDEQASR